MDEFKIGDVVMVSATITEKIETKSGFFYMVSPFHSELTPYQSMKVCAADIFPAQKPVVSK